MLRITIPGRELYDERTEEFVNMKGCTLSLEHSLVSLAKWESKWCKPFLSNDKEKTYEETLDYIRFMTVTQNVDPRVYENLSRENIQKINDYIEAPMTATTIREKGGKGSKEIVTAELIYYWMIALQIPFECQKWHLNRLLMLIRVCNVKNQPSKKMSKRDVMSRNTSLNAARRKAMGSRG